MKKLSFILVLALLLTQALPTEAAIATPWSATSTDIGFIQPNPVNGNIPFLKFPNLQATSTTASSTFMAQIVAAYNSVLNPHLFFGDGTNNTDFGFAFAGGRGMVGYDNSAAEGRLILGGGSAKGIEFFVNQNNGVLPTASASGIPALSISGGVSGTAQAVGVGTTSPYLPLSVAGQAIISTAGSIGSPSLIIGTTGNNGLYQVSNATLGITNGSAAASWNGSAFYPNTNNIRDLGLVSTNLWNHLFVNFASTTALTISTLGTPAGTFLAVDPNGNVIATTTPAGSGTNYFTLTGSQLQNNVGNGLGINVAPNTATFEVQASSTTAAPFAFWNSVGASLLYMSSGGRLELGTSTSANAGLNLIDTNSTACSGLDNLTIGGNPGGDTDFWLCRNSNNDSVDNDSLQFGKGLVPGTTPYMTIRSTGFLGIGTTTPVNYMDAEKTIDGNAIFALNNFSAGVSASARLKVINNAGTQGEMAMYGSNFSNANFRDRLTFGSSKGMQFLADKDTNSAGTDQIAFTTGGFAMTPAMIITGPAGLVGIGSSTPWGQLSASSTSVFPTLAIQQNSTGAAATFLGGNVGIGTTSPWAQLSINTKTTGVPFAIGSSTGSNFLVGQNGNVSIGFLPQAVTPVPLLINSMQSDTPLLGASLGAVSNETILMSAAGGTPVWGQRLTATGNNWAWDYRDSASGNPLNLFTMTRGGRTGFASTTPFGQVSINPNALTAGIPSFVIGSSTATAVIVDNSGSVGIATTTPIVGNVLTTNGGVYMHAVATGAGNGAVCMTTDGQIQYDAGANCILSSLRFKNVDSAIAPSDALNTVLALKPIYFHYKPGYEDNGAAQWEGFGAEDVAKVDTNLVQYDASNTPYSVYYQNITAKLVGAVQELNKRTVMVQRSAEENWQWIAITLLFGLLLAQQYQIAKLRK